MSDIWNFTYYIEKYAFIIMQETLHLISEVGIGEKMFRFNDFSTLPNLIIKNLSLTLFYVFKDNLKQYDISI